MERRAHAVLDAARAAGITYLDAARSYGRAEAFVRDWLDARQLPPGAVVVGSKWGYRYVGGWQLDAEQHEVKDHSAEALARSSRSRAGCSARTSGSTRSTPPRPRPASSTTTASSTGSRRCATGHPGGGDGERERAGGDGPPRDRGRRGGAPLFAAVQATWNVLERSCEDALREARAAGRTVIVKEVLANGRLPRAATRGARVRSRCSPATCTSGRTRSRSRRRWRGRGRTWCCSARTRWSSSSRTCARSRSAPGRPCSAGSRGCARSGRLLERARRAPVDVNA